MPMSNDPSVSGRAMPYQPRPDAAPPSGGGRQTGGPGSSPGVLTPPSIDPGSGTAPTGGGRQTAGPGSPAGVLQPPSIDPGSGTAPTGGGRQTGNPFNPTALPPPAGGPVNTPTGGNPFTPPPNAPTQNPWINPANANLPWNYFAQMLQHFSNWHNGQRRP